MDIRKCLTGLAAAVLAAAPLFAQETRGRVQGAVRDEQGGIIPGATVTLTNGATGISASRVSNRDGRYLFDYVDPGLYSITVELTGFGTVVQPNVVVQQRGDVTVDVGLKIGAIQEIVTVTESPVAVQFNTASHDLTVEQRLVQDLPSSTRNPLGLAMLDPSAVNRGSTVETQPYHHRTANEVDLGGGAKYRNDVVLDGTPLIAGNKLGYTPPIDAVTEYTVQSNAVDAEFGHNSGGVSVVTMKSGSNDYHGSAYYYGRDASLNAISDRTVHQHNDNPYWNAGATFGFPVIKNKLFVFSVFERIENTQSAGSYYSLPTELERQGDFSQSYNADGSLRVIYDPLTTRLVNGRYVRDPFPGNRIPQARWDALSSTVLANLWDANSAPDDLTGFQNFKYTNENKFHYYNFSTRVDWQVNQNWKAWGRVSRIKTDQDATDFTNGADPMKIRNVAGSKRNGWNIAADTVYTFNPSTSLNVRGSFYQVEDKRDYPEMDIGDYSSFWSDPWWQPYMEGRPLVYAPSFTVEGARNTFGVANYWYQEPKGYSVHTRFNKYLTRHSLKVGSEVRWKRGQAARFRYFGTAFRFNETAGYNAAGTQVSTTGHPWASFLLGTMNASATVAQYTPMQTANTEMYAVYVQDDFRITPKLSVNLGLRYEYEGGFWDDQYRLQQQLDMADPIPGMQEAIDPLIPANVKAIMAQSAGQNSYLYNGAFYFTEPDNKRNTSASRMQLMPRVGLSWRIDERTALRAGYGRFYTPTSLIMPDRDANGELPMGAYSPTTSALPDVGNVPQVRFSNPFPQGLIDAYGKERGRYTQLGDSIIIDEHRQKPPISDRINLSLQRELPGRIVADVTYLINFVSRDQWPQQLNIVDPRLFYQYGAALNASVANPFYNYETVDTFPGPLRDRRTVATWELLKPHPQYGPIVQTASDLRKSRFQSFQVRLQRPFANGVSVMLTYGYNTQRTQVYYDSQDEYDGVLTWVDGNYSPAGGTPAVRADGLNNYANTGTGMNYAIDPLHAFRAAFTADLPFGRGRAVGGEMSKALDAVVGGWKLSGTFRYDSGSKLVFGAMTAPAEVETVGGIGRDTYWFDTTGFAQQPAYTRRSNPWYYDSLTGPNFKNLDLSLAKRFQLKDRYNLWLRLEAYNALNMMNWANPTLTVTSSDFGKVTAQAAGYYGRQLQYSLKFEF